MFCSFIFNEEPEDVWKIGSVSNLWDIMRNYGHLFYKMASGLMLIHRYATQESRATEPFKNFEGMIPKLLEMFENIRKHCVAFQFPVSANKCQYAIDYINEFASSGLTAKEVDEIVRLADIVAEDIRIECEPLQFYRMSRETSHYYASNQFSSSVVRKFSVVIYDMEEAGKCYALGRYTATALHLMRVAECGLKSITAHYGLTVNRRDWKNHLDAIEKKIREIKNSTESERLSKLHFRLDRFREAWRNPTMHIDRTYQSEEAKEVFDAVKLLMESAAELISDP